MNLYCDVRVCLCDWLTSCVIDGLAPPIDKWQKAVNSQLEKIKKLEEIYESELILRKVGVGSGQWPGACTLISN